MSSNAAWGTDTTISMPVPPATSEPTRPVATGFAYTRFGLVHDLTTSDVEGYLLPAYLPLDVEER
jgi:hypothetical protein